MREDSMAGIRRIGVYGGTFDPVHLGHLRVAERLLEVFALDLVLFIPAYLAPHKRSAGVSPALDRYAMLVLATAQDERLCVSTIELDAPGRPYTVETLAGLHERLGPEVELFFVMGADSWNEIDTWREWERLLGISNHVVVSRPGFEPRKGHVTAKVRERIIDLRGLEPDKAVDLLGSPGGNRVYFTDVVNVDISATYIRDAIRKGEVDDALSLVPRPVADYIRKYGLYTNEYRKQHNDQGTVAPS
jgi:nicotinate-nucleotide adenylyltransferase